MNVPLVDRLSAKTGLPVYPRSVAQGETATYFLVRGASRRLLAILGDRRGFEGSPHGDVLLCPLSPANAAALRDRVPWLRPQRLGLARCAGCGDRLGLATPGHVRAVRQVEGAAPVFAQQSVRENARAGRTAVDIVDDAMWGVLQEGWQEPWGADADHLKTPEDVEAGVAAGNTFFTFDPGDHMDVSAQTASLPELEAKCHRLPWGDLHTTQADLRSAYLHRTFALDGGGALTFDEESLWRGAAKYGHAIAHVARLYDRLCQLTRDFELEVSVDETETPTTPLEHFLIASELGRLQVRWVSMAPRYVGRFEKGVDYIGDLKEFETDLALQAAVARTLGPYKLGLHSGSDKFSVYPLFTRHAGELVHLKTAGTSYLEALRTIARAEPQFFRLIYNLAFERYAQDRLTYHVSAEPAHAPQPAEVADSDLPAVIDQFDAREMLHVTFGSALAAYGDRLKVALWAHEEEYAEALAAHLGRHVRALVGAKG